MASWMFTARNVKNVVIMGLMLSNLKYEECSDHGVIWWLCMASIGLNPYRELAGQVTRLLQPQGPFPGWPLPQCSINMYTCMWLCLQ